MVTLEKSDVIGCTVKNKSAIATILTGMCIVTACQTQATPSPAEPKVSGAFGRSPEIEIPHSPPPGGVTIRSVTRGDGAQIAKTDWVKVNVTSKIWGKDRGTSTYDKKGGAHPQVLSLEDKRGVPDFFGRIVGKHVGERIAFTSPVERVFEDAPLPKGISPSDTLVTVVDVMSAMHPTALPKNKEKLLNENSLHLRDVNAARPDLVIPGAFQPAAKLNVCVVTKGGGARLRPGETVVVNSSGFNLPGGSLFQSTWDSGSRPLAFQLGAHQVIAGLDQALVGRTVGDRLIIEVPPRLGYGDNPPPRSKVAPNSNLAFVVDVLGVL